MTARRYTMTATAVRTWKTKGVLLRNCQIHGKFMVIPLTNPIPSMWLHVCCVQACRPCHHECIGCYGPSEGACERCANYKQRGHCVASCLHDYYVNETMKTCIECDRQCYTCHGPTAAGCITCRVLKLYHILEDRGPDAPVCLFVVVAIIIIVAQDSF